MTTKRSSFLFGGEGEIRTLGELPHDGFQDRYLKPLGHLSVKGTKGILPALSLLV